MAMTNAFTGANGRLFLVAGEKTDARAIMDLPAYNLFDVGRVTDVEISVQTHLEEFHEIGRRHAVSLHPGDIHISGKIGRAYINGALLYLLMGRGASPNNIDEVAKPYAQPTFAMNVVLADPAVPGNRAILDLSDVKFQDWAYTIPEDDFVLENVTFKAVRIDVRDEVDKKLTTPSFPEQSAT